jgi:hypothetical protein
MQATSPEEFMRLAFPAIQKVAKQTCCNVEIVKIEWDDFRYSETVSNSHSCPVNGVTNWCGTNDNLGYPRSYPGWTSKIYVQLSNLKYSNLSTLLNLVEGLNTGNGGIHRTGSGNYPTRDPEDYYVMSYEISIFQQDLPSIRGKFLGEKIGVL